jgi:hypothetical protein
MVVRLGALPPRCPAAFALAGFALAVSAGDPAPAAVLHGVSWDASGLYQIGLGGFAVDPDIGAVYMSNGFSLFTVDSGTGAATEVGAHGEIIPGPSFRTTPAPAPTCLLGLDGTSPSFDVDPTDGSGSNLRPMGVDRLGSHVRSPGGTLYVSMDSQLVTLNPTTGATTPLGPTPATSGLEVVGPRPSLPPPPIPAMGPLALLALGSGLCAGGALHLRHRA